MNYAGIVLEHRVEKTLFIVIASFPCDSCVHVAKNKKTVARYVDTERRTDGRPNIGA